MLTRFMPRLAQGISALSTQIETAKRDYLDARAAAMPPATRAFMVTQIIDFWIALGAPPVTPAEAVTEFVELPTSLRRIAPPYWQPYLPKPSTTAPRARA